MNEIGTSFWRSAELSGLELLRAKQASFSYPKHSHNAYSIGVVEAGVSVNYCCGAKQYFNQEAIILINPEQAHTGYSQTKSSSYRMLYVSKDAMKDVLGIGELPVFKKNIVYNKLLASRIISLHGSIENGAEAIYLQEGFSSILLELIAKYSSLPAPKQGNEHFAVRKIKNYLRNNYAKNIAVDELAQLTGLNRAYLMRVFHKQVGITIHAYLIQLRIEAAKSIILKQQNSAQTALQLGFADQSHFIRSFKKLTGDTPNRYLKKSLSFNNPN